MKKIAFKFIKFGIVGASGVFVNQGVLMLLGSITSISLEFRSPIAIEIAIVSNFLLNYHWTWRDNRDSSNKKRRVQFLQFNASSGITAITCNYIPLLIMVRHFNLNENISNIIGIILASGINFLISHFYTFKPKNLES